MFRRLWQRVPNLVIFLAVFTSPCWVGAIVLLALRQYTVWFEYTEEDRAHRGEGHPSDARQWRETLKGIPNIDVVERNPELIDPKLLVKLRFSNDEWVFGIARDSHEPAIFSGVRGGTVVLRDSRGRIRIFYGHVCGIAAPMYGPGSQAKTLDEFYDTLTPKWGYTEQFLPP